MTATPRVEALEAELANVRLAFQRELAAKGETIARLREALDKVDLADDLLTAHKIARGALDVTAQYQPAKVMDAAGRIIVRFDTAKDDATASLIACAPELYEALEYLESVLSEQSEETFEMELAHIRAALRKAKGET